MVTFNEEEFCRVMINRMEINDFKLFTTFWVGLLTMMLKYVGDRRDRFTACLAWVTSLE